VEAASSFSSAGSFAVTNGFNAILWNGASFGWSTSSAVGVASSNFDLVLARDAADTLAQRRGVNAQAFRIYRTFTDASNYERTSIGWIGTQFFISTEGAGTGVARQLFLYAGAGSGIWLGTNGQGRWEIVSGGSIIAGFDNAYDIGATAGNRPRNLFLGSYAQLSEMTAPAAPAADSVRIYAVDNGSGKTQLMALFATGAAQQIAIEP
jgi:hypothetical protein